MAHDHHDHAHAREPGQGHGRPTAERALWVALLLNAGFLVVELVVGLLANSLALLSDAGHMTSDVAALALALVAQRLARTAPGPNFTFGLRRVPVLGALGNALSLLIIAALILWEAYHRMQAPPSVPGWPVLVAGVVGLAVNLVSAWFLHRSAEKSLNIRGAMLHLFADALGSLGVIAAALVLLTTGWELIDPLISAGIGLLLVAASWPLLRDTTRVLLQGAPGHIDLERLRALLAQSPQVCSVADLHLWQIDLGQVVLTAVLVTDRTALPELDTASQALKARLRDELGIHHATFEWCAPGSGGATCAMHTPDATEPPGRPA
jgi:cobalt-zinc-cadmium efflux system protein